MGSAKNLPSLGRAVEVLGGGDLPFKTVFSVEPLLDFWRRVGESSESTTRGRLSRSILESVEKAPELRGEIEDLAVVEKHRDVVELMLTGVLPLALGDREYAGAVVPFTMKPAFRGDVATSDQRVSL